MSEKTVFQRLTDTVIGTGNGSMSQRLNKSLTYNIDPSSEILFTTNSKEERDRKLLQMKQDKLLAHQWRKIGYDTTMQEIAGANQTRVMYRDADMMDQWPEISAALDIYKEEATTINTKGKMLNIYSKSDRIQAVLEDLFINRLDINIFLPSIVRDTCKYGNDFMFLNIDSTNGITGWMRLPVNEMSRLENGMQTLYGGAGPNTNTYNLKPDEVKFVWEGHNNDTPYKNWQVAHFRLIGNTLYLPYGVSLLNGARRHWRMLSMMEDGMLIYRLERSIERRIFKVNVGNIDDADIPAFLQEFMNGVKRAPIIDPLTGQVDLRKNFLDVSADYVIPVRNGQDPTSIDTLNAAQNSTSMDDIQYMENKVLAALRVPKSFLNFQEAQGKSQNLSLLDIRFNRSVNTIQQAILMELNKVAIIHLAILGYDSDLTNFTLTMNNPSNQIEMMELDNLTKRIGAAANALAEQGGGIPIMSWYTTQKEIMGRTDKEIGEELNRIRLENAIANELQLTSQIIEKTGLFDKTDRVYGKPGAKYDYSVLQGGPDGGMGGGGGFGGGMPMGDDFGDGLGDLGEPGADMEGSIGGEEGSADLGSMGENIFRVNGREIISEAYKKYMNMLNHDEIYAHRPDIVDKTLFINEEMDGLLKGLENTMEQSREILKEDIISDEDLMTD